MTSQPIDYAALAEQARQQSAPKVDYAALAEQARSGSAPAKPAEDTGVMASLKRTTGGLMHLPGAVIDAFTKPPQNPEEEAVIGTTKGTRFEGDAKISLALKRLIGDPMKAERDKAAQMHEQAKTQTDEQANNAYNGTNHLANMHAIAGHVPVFGPMAADMTQRYLTGDKSGAVTDLGTAVAGPKIAEGVVGGASRMVSKVAPQVAEKLYSSALKPSTTIPAGQRAAIVRTGLDAGIPVSEQGAAKLSGLINDLNDKIKAQIDAGQTAGKTVDPQAVASRLDQTRARFTNQVNPESDLAAIDSAQEEFLRRQGQTRPGAAGPNNQIPLADAQALKQGTYQQLKGRAYGELKGATVESQKALARGLKEEIETQFPEIKGMNAQESKFYNLDGVLERAINRIGNHQLIGIGTPIVAGAAGGVGGSGTGIAMGLLKAVFDDPMVKSRLAIAISKAGKVAPSAANARVMGYVNALAQSQPQDTR